MNSTLLIVLNIILIGLEIWMIACLANSFFVRVSSKKRYIWSFIAFYILSVLALTYLDKFAVTKLLCTVLLPVIWILLNYSSGIVKSSFTSILLLAYLTVADNAFLGLCSIFSNSNIGSLLEEPYTYYALCFCLKIFELFGIILLCAWAKRHFRQQRPTLWSDWLRILFFPLTILLVTFFQTRILFNSPQSSKELLVCSMILLFADVLSVFLLDYLEKQQDVVRDNAVLRQNLKLEAEHINSLKNAYTEQRAQTHDFHNQLAVLRGMAEQQASQEEFTNYLNSLLAIKVPSVFYIDTHRPAVDVILSQKIPLAKSKGIRFQLALDDLSTFPLPDDALVVVLTNLIDNAIEACNEIESGKLRFIMLKMRVVNDIAWLCIENTTSRAVIIQDNQVKTTKGNSFTHGYGLKNIFAVLDQHSAMYTLDYRSKDDMFCFYANIPII